MKQHIMEFVISTWQEQRLYQLHYCPDCVKAWIKNILWSEIEIASYGPRKKGIGICINCNKKITIVLAGEWIELWAKQWGWKEWF